MCYQFTSPAANYTKSSPLQQKESYISLPSLLQAMSVSVSAVSFDRRSRSFEEDEVALLNEVRRLRQRLATENREKRPPRREASAVEAY